MKENSGIAMIPIISLKQHWLLCLALISILAVSQLTLLLFSPNCSKEAAVTPNGDNSATARRASLEGTTTTTATTPAAAASRTTTAETLAASDTTTTTISSARRIIKRPVSQLGTCGLPWKQYLQTFTFPVNSSTLYTQRQYDTTTSTTITTTTRVEVEASSSSSLPLVWSVSGGAEYRSYVGDLLHHWYTIEPDVSFLVVALDQETADVVCGLGYNAVYWDAPAQSYSRVADAKLQVPVAWVDRGIDALFIELDVLCRWSPIRLFQEAAQQQNASLVWVGHGKVSYAINIGEYYVRADPAVGDLFREVAQVLAPSRDEREFLNPNGRILSYFDQDAFRFCLHIHENWRPRWYRLADVNQTYDLFTACQKHAPFTHTSLSTMLIANEDPPTPHDSTYCIHTLAGTPFSSFRYKLVKSKIFGFDPVEWRPDERFLKTQSGDLAEFVWLEWKGYYNNTEAQREFKSSIAVLILLSQLSNRTLVLPRHVLDKEFNTYPVYGLVDVATIEDLVPWRYLSQSDVHPYRNETVEISAQDYSSNLTALIEAVQNCHGRFCSIEQFANINDGYPWYANLKETIIEKVKWCVEWEGVKPSLALGAFARPCDSWIWDKTGGMYH